MADRPLTHEDIEDAEEGDVFVLEPPGACTCNCGDLIGCIVIPTNDDRCMVHPCHCELTPDELQAVFVRNHPHLKDSFDD